VYIRQDVVVQNLGRERHYSPAQERGKMIFKKVYYWLYIVSLSVKWLFQINLGNSVWYGGTRHTVYNGVYPESWRLSGVTQNDGWVPRSDCKLVLTLPNLWHSISSGYSFYMTCWYSIWVRNGIEPWVRECHIWPGKRRAGD